jgi:hypothetical protein
MEIERVYDRSLGVRTLLSEIEKDIAKEPEAKRLYDFIDILSHHGLKVLQSKFGYMVTLNDVAGFGNEESTKYLPPTDSLEIIKLKDFRDINKVFDKYMPVIRVNSNITMFTDGNWHENVSRILLSQTIKVQPWGVLQHKVKGLNVAKWGDVPEWFYSTEVKFAYNFLLTFKYIKENKYNIKIMKPKYS